MYAYISILSSHYLNAIVSHCYYIIFKDKDLRHLSVTVVILLFLHISCHCLHSMMFLVHVSLIKTKFLCKSIQKFILYSSYIIFVWVNLILPVVWYVFYYSFRAFDKVFRYFWGYRSNMNLNFKTFLIITFMCYCLLHFLFYTLCNFLVPCSFLLGNVADWAI